MRKEDYITKECARLAQQKGFPLRKVYKDNGDRPLFYDLPKEHPDWSQCDAWYYPTLWELQRWLRETHSVNISILLSHTGWRLQTQEVICGELFERKRGEYPTYEAALQAGIMKALKTV